MNNQSSIGEIPENKIGETKRRDLMNAAEKQTTRE